MEKIQQLENEIKSLVQGFAGSMPATEGFEKNKAEMVAFLKTVNNMALSEARVGAGESTEITIACSLETLVSKTSLTPHVVKKYLRWAAKGLKILSCKIPKQPKNPELRITMGAEMARDLDWLLCSRNRVGIYDNAVEVAVNKFKHKSLSAFSLNVAIGCFFGCRFCYVPSASTIWLGWKLVRYGVLDADADWGDYCLIRRWDEKKFRKSLAKAVALPKEKIAPDGHRAVMLCTNTDPYQPVFHPDPMIRAKLGQYLRLIVRRSLEILLEPEFQTLNVRILTRGLAVKEDFDLMRKFGNRLILGMSVPTLDNRLARLYEPKAPAPTRRLEMLHSAKRVGIPVYVAMAPTYPECGESDIRRSMEAIADLNPLTIFAEPINARAKNVDRIENEAMRKGMETKAGIIRGRETRIRYAIEQLKLIEKVAGELGIQDKLHLWPDQELAAEEVVKIQPDPESYRSWIKGYHYRISEWPGKDGPGSYSADVKGRG